MPKSYIKKKGSTVPFGYELSEIKGYVKPIPKQQESLLKFIKLIQEEKITLREAALQLSEEAGRSISHVGLSKIVKKLEPPPPPSKYRYSAEQKRKMQLAKKQKEIQKAKDKILAKERKLKIEQDVIKKATEATQSNVVLEEDLKTVAPSLQEVIRNSKIIFHPNEGPQTDFLAADEKDVLYGGAAGGGKSYAMIVDPLRYAHKKAHRALILRRSMPELREMIDKSRELYPQAFPGARFREVEKLWNFPSGAKVEFGFLERDADVYRYQGQAYSWIGFDEITHLPTEFSWNYLASRLRTTDPEIKTYLRCTANPGGVGSHWVKNRYIEPHKHNKSFEGKDGLTRKFIPAKLADNPYLARDGIYEQMLKSLPPIQRRQLLEGNWDVAEGAAFVEFDPHAHVIPPFELPVHWERLKGIDYGYASESCCLWGILDINDNTLIIYRELYRKGLTGRELGAIITDMELEDPFSVNGVLDTAAWANTGTTGPTVGEELLKAGHKLRRADKNRIQGKIQIHEYLKTRENGRPKLQIFNTCPNLIRELQSIPLSKTRPEDVDTLASDHAYDALRYMIMSRPRMENPLERIRGFKREMYKPADSEFGY